MLITVILIIACLAYVNYHFGAAGPLYPGVVFCAVWAADLLLLCITGDHFFPLSAPTLAVLVSGCLMFSLGCFAVSAFAPGVRRSSSREVAPGSSRSLNALMGLVVLGAPFFIRWALDLASGHDANIIAAVRWATVVDTEDLPDGYSFYFNIATLSTIVAVIAFCERGRARRMIAIGAAFVLNLMTGAKTGIVMLLCCMFAIDALRHSRVRWKPAVVGFLVLALVFGFVSIELANGDTDPSAPLTENVVGAAYLFVEYAVGGIVAFDRVARDPDMVPHSWPIGAFFVQSINKLGGHLKAPPEHTDFVEIGPKAAPENVYTLYFAYLDYGFTGTILILFLLGTVCTYCYWRAISGSRIALVMYGALFNGMVLSAFGELFFRNLNFLVKLYAVSWVVYSLAPRWLRGSQQDLGTARGLPLVPNSLGTR